MYEVKIIDHKKPIIYLRWYGVVKKEEVEQSTKELFDCWREIGERKFYILVDCADLNVFAPDTKENIIAQQTKFFPYLIKAPSIVQKAVTKIQIQQTVQAADNPFDVPFKTYGEAIDYINRHSKGEV